MSQRPDSQNYREIFLNDIPLMDVRAPVEYLKGAFPRTVNVPILNDEQREAVGLRYKEQGQDAAIELGWTLATPAIKEQRLHDWHNFIRQHPQGYLYCFRGGLRSQLTQQLIKDSGIDYPLIKGGYKAMRRFLIDELDQNCSDMPITVIGGRTGSGKTRLIQRIDQAVDLEGLAHHRGSAFGRHLTPQPAQIDFENTLSIDIMKKRKHHATIVMEDEGRMIGQLNLPLSLTQAIQAAPLVVLEASTDERINMALDDYVLSQLPEYLQCFGEALGQQKFREEILGNLHRIRKRLGADKFQNIYAQFDEALTSLELHGDTEGFKPGIKQLLLQYYDPMYDYQQDKRQGKKLFRGTFDEIKQWITDHQTPS